MMLCVCLLTQLCPTLCLPWTATCQALRLGLRQNTGVGFHALLKGSSLTQGMNSVSLRSPALSSRFFTTSTAWETPVTCSTYQQISKWKVLGENYKMGEYIDKCKYIHAYMNIFLHLNLYVSLIDIFPVIFHLVPQIAAVQSFSCVKMLCVNGPYHARC